MYPIHPKGIVAVRFVMFWIITEQLGGIDSWYFCIGLWGCIKLKFELNRLLKFEWGVDGKMVSLIEVLKDKGVEDLIGKWTVFDEFGWKWIFWLTFIVYIYMKSMGNVYLYGYQKKCYWVYFLQYFLENYEDLWVEESCFQCL